MQIDGVPRLDDNAVRSGYLPYRLRHERVFFTRKDAGAFTRALLAEFPFAVFYTVGETLERPVLFHASLGACPSEYVYVEIADAHWRPVLGPGPKRDSVWIVNPPRLGFSYVARHDLDTEDDRTEAEGGTRSLWGGSVIIQYRPGDQDGTAFSRRIVKILRSVSTSRLLRYRPSTGETADPGKPVSGYHAGPDAIAWCLKHESRYFSGTLELLRPRPPSLP